MTLRVCSISGCGRKHYAKSFCLRHHSRWRRHGDPLGGMNRCIEKICTIDGCGKRSCGRGLCQKHYRKWSLYGSPTAGKEHERHGMCRAPEHNVWINMNARCRDKNRPDFKYYGGRGISVCDRWSKSFQHFLEDMGSRPEGTQLDRIDNSKGYSKENCRWVTRRENMQNTRRTRLNSNLVNTIRFSQANIGTIAETLHVNRSTVNNVRRGKTWTNVVASGPEFEKTIFSLKILFDLERLAREALPTAKYPASKSIASALRKLDLSRGES